MSSAQLRHYFVAFDRQTRDTEVIDLGPDVEVAMREYRRRERELVAKGLDVEIVALGSQSEETLRHTHSSYFREGADLGGVLPIPAA